jgi:hypothetical protein
MTNVTMSPGIPLHRQLQSQTSLTFLCAILSLAAASTLVGQEFSSDTSYVKARGKDLFIGFDSVPIVHLLDPGTDFDAAVNPRFGTFLPLSSIAPDSSAVIVLITHAFDALSYAVVQPRRREWTIVQGEAARVYWAGGTQRAAVLERFLSGMERIRIIDYTGPSARVFTCPDTIRPADQENGKRMAFDRIEWSSANDTLRYTIVTTFDGSRTQSVIRKFAVPRMTKLEEQK